MRSSNRGRRTPYVRPVKRVELSETNVKIRMILIVIFLAIAVVSIIVGFRSVLQTEPGWQQVKVQSVQLHCGDDFVFDYDFSDAGSAATSQFKNLTAVYSAACERAFLFFSPDVAGDGSANVHDLNRRPNEVMTVDPVLHDALALVQQYGNRSLYLAAVYEEYGRIFLAENEVEAAASDPAQNPELIGFFAEAAAFASDPAMVDIQLLGENQVILQVSDEYLAFLKANELESIIDFGWMKNAFIADYLAQVLIDSGFTNGYLASFDGFTRNLDTRGNRYSFNVFDRTGDGVNVPAVLRYTAPSAIVFLRDYPMSQKDAWHYYAFPNGRVASLLIDPADGTDKTAIDSLVSYAEGGSCADVLMQMIPVFIADKFHAGNLRALVPDCIYSIWCEDRTVMYTDMNADISLLQDAAYTKVFAGE